MTRLFAIRGRARQQWPGAGGRDFQAVEGLIPIGSDCMYNKENPGLEPGSKTFRVLALTIEP